VDVIGPTSHFFVSQRLRLHYVDWGNADRRAVGILLDGRAIPEVDAHGYPVSGDTLLILLNASAEDVPFLMPDAAGGTWQERVNTAGLPRPSARRPGKPVTLVARSSAVFVRMS